jgi:hypothetical protein
LCLPGDAVARSSAELSEAGPLDDFFLSSESSDKLVCLLKGFFAPSELASGVGDFVGRPNSEDPAPKLRRTAGPPSESSEEDLPLGRLTGDCVPWSE